VAYIAEFKIFALISGKFLQILKSAIRKKVIKLATKTPIIALTGGSEREGVSLAPQGFQFTTLEEECLDYLDVADAVIEALEGQQRVNRLVGILQKHVKVSTVVGRGRGRDTRRVRDERQQGE